MSQRFTVSKSDGERRPSDIQGEVNQLFEGDEPATGSSAEADGSAAGGEVLVVLKGKRQTHLSRWLRSTCRCPLAAGGCRLADKMLSSCAEARCLWTDVCVT